MSEITKEELAMMIDVQSKSVSNLEKIANSLKTMVDEQKNLNESQKELLLELKDGTVKRKLDKICGDVLYTKWLFSSIGILVILVTVLGNILQIGS
jgi:hypothetical protein